MPHITVPRFHPHDFRLEGPRGPQNPFLVGLRASFEHESDARIEGVPGFYDGDGTWVVRFSPTQEGRWEGVTAADEPQLDGVALGPVTCAANTNTAVHGRLGVDDAHSRRFAWEDGTPFVLLGFEFDWMFAYHQAQPEKCRDALAVLKERGFNYIVTNVYAHTGFSDRDSGHVYGPPGMYAFGGTNEKPDHSVLNPGFFQDLDRLVAYLHEKGIVAHFMVQVQNKHVNWPARGSVQDDLYWRYVVSRYQAYGNIVWDVGKESYNLLRETGSHDYTISRIRLIRETDAYDHLVTVHDSETGSAARSSEADDECDFVSDQIHLKDAGAYYREAVRRYRSDRRPYLNIEYGYEFGAERIKTYSGWTTAPWEDVLVWTWAIYAGGGYPCYYYDNMAWDLVKPEPEPPGWQRYQWLAAFLARFDLNAMAPDSEFVSRGFCLTEPGRQYLIFLPRGGDVDIDLTAVNGNPRWLIMDVFTGVTIGGDLENNGFRTTIRNPLEYTTHPCAIAVMAGEVEQ
jgi:hypothetical protein